MAKTSDPKFRAGNTEPLTFEFTGTATSEVTTSDISSGVFYARERGADDNHIDGASLGSISASSTDNGDGTWDVTITAVLDPVGNGPDGNDAWATGDDGQYRCYGLFTFTDTETARYPDAENGLIVTITPNYE